MFKIEKGITIPLPGMDVYPFAEMEVGDSFAVPFENSGYKDVTSMASGLSGMATRYLKLSGEDKKFTVRMMNGKTEVRIWRTA